MGEKMSSGLFQEMEAVLRPPEYLFLSRPKRIGSQSACCLPICAVCEAPVQVGRRSVSQQKVSGLGW